MRPPKTGTKVSILRPTATRENALVVRANRDAVELYVPGRTVTAKPHMIGDPVPEPVAPNEEPNGAAWHDFPVGETRRIVLAGHLVSTRSNPHADSETWRLQKPGTYAIHVATDGTQRTLGEIEPVVAVEISTNDAPE